MGNEFGHPEWIDFPRAGNDWTYHYARRQWSLRDNEDLHFHTLGNFDQALLNLIKEEMSLGAPLHYARSMNRIKSLRMNEAACSSASIFTRRNLNRII